MKLTICLIALALLALHYRRRWLRANDRLAAAMATNDCLRQRRWRRNETARRIRILRLEVRTATAVISEQAGDRRAERMERLFGHAN